MIVVDTNVIAFYLMEGRQTAAAQAVWRKDNVWMVPVFWRFEFESVLWKLARSGTLARRTALELLEKALALFAPNEMTPRPDSVLRDALDWSISVYDAQYISLARDLGVPCVTEDKAVPKACPTIALSMDQFLRAPSDSRSVRESPGAYITRAKRKESRKAAS